MLQKNVTSQKYRHVSLGSNYALEFSSCPKLSAELGQEGNKAKGREGKQKKKRDEEKEGKG